MKFILTMALVASIEICLAEPFVLGEEGGTIDSNGYKAEYKLLVEREQIKNYRVAHKNPQRAGDLELNWSSLLPIKSEKLSAGLFDDLPVDKKSASNPFCLVGYDQLSLKWLSSVKDVLVEQRAVCFIVNVETDKELLLLREALNPVPWQLLYGDELAADLGISKYPALISEHGIEQ